ncbi:MAG: hypothetical protein A2076_04030 [Geobacteraceae bacterium GWC2_53_11]|nr:MAG: hypothetical protein A2076_04030 [Geobacteraceae bacterium GWC2_53_11]
MNQRLFSLCTPCPEGFSFCGEFRSRDFRSAPFALHAPSPEAAGEFLGSHLDRLAGVILVPGEHLSTRMLAEQLSLITFSPPLFPYLADFAGHQLRQLDQLVSNEENTARLALEHERLSGDNRRAAEEFEQFRSSLLREIEERRMAERQLSDSEEQLRQLISSTGEAIYGIDIDGNCTFANESCLSNLGYEQIGDMLGRNMHDLIHYSTPDGTLTPVEECRIYKAFREGVGVKVEGEYFWRRDGTCFPVEYSSYPIRKDEAIVGGVVIWRDITERKRAEEERRTLEQQLLHAQKLESLGVLAGGIAHDFNNILTTIIGNANLALMRINPESPAVENLHRIELAASQAAELAKQMLAYSGKGKFLVERLDINRLLEEMLHMLEVSISENALLRFNLTRPLPPVEADVTQMRQIIMNLVINASEAIGERNGLITITTGCRECTSDYLKEAWLAKSPVDGLYVYLEISDNGCGMDNETLVKIFDPFFTTKFTGRGLGMAAVLGIVRGHHGAIKASSEPGKGTTFQILLPATLAGRC